jgi:hypothetical protein
MFPFLDMLSAINPMLAGGMANGMATNPEQWAGIMSQIMPQGPEAAMAPMGMGMEQDPMVGQALMGGGAPPMGQPQAPLPGMMRLGGPPPAGGPMDMGMGEGAAPEFPGGPGYVSPEAQAGAAGASMGVVDPMNPTIGSAGQPAASYAQPVIPSLGTAPGAGAVGGASVVPPGMRAAGGPGPQGSGMPQPDNKPIMSGGLPIQKPNELGIKQMMLLSQLLGPKAGGAAGSRVGTLGSYV